jgi:hypothetical protein
MKFSIKPLLFLLAVLAFSFFACDDDEDTQTPADFLTGTSCWTQVKIELYNDSTNSWLTFLNFPPDCSKDDCILFNGDNTLVMDRGMAKCDSTETQIITGTWSLGADGSTVTFVRDDLGNILIYTVTELSGSKMVVENDFLGSKSRDTYEAR